jgi:Tol biopolymer transport system component
MAHLGVTVALIAIAGYFLFRPPSAEIMRFQVSPAEKTIFASPIGVPGGANGGTISPDGKRLVFSAADAAGKTLLWVRSLDSLAPEPLNGTDGGSFPFWSPDSRYVGFFDANKLKKIEASGGPPQTLCDGGSSRGGTWSSDGVILFQPQIGGPLFRVSAEGGQPVAVTSVDESPGTHRWPYFLPDGRHFLFRIDGSAAENTGIFIGSLDSSETKRLLGADENAVYAPAGYVLFTREGTLMAQRFDADRLELVGEPFPIAEEISRDPGVRLAEFSVSTNGILTYRSGGNLTTQLTWVDRAGRKLQSVGPPGNYSRPMLSPDEKRVAFTRADGQQDIWILELGREVLSRLTFSPENDDSPIWSPDGSKIAFASSRDGGGVYQKTATGAGPEELLLKSGAGANVNHWSPDGKYILFFRAAARTNQDIWILPLTSDRKPQIYLQTEFIEGEAQFSPDGRWIAYTSNETGRFEVYVQPFPTTGAKYQVSTSGGRQPFWRRDGKELFFVSDDRRFFAVDVQTGSTFQVGTPKFLFNMQANVTNTRNSYHPSADGQRFLVNMLLETASSPITVVVNWTAALNK